MWNVPNCLLLMWAVAIMPVKELSILPECPLHPVFPEQFECCVIAMCHFEICTGLQIFYSENEEVYSSENRGWGCPVASKTSVPSALSPKIRQNIQNSFMSVHSVTKLHE